MDIQYLLLLQQLREAAGSLLTPLMQLVSDLAASSVTIGAAAFVFWAVDRHFGGFLMLNYVGSSLLVQVAKLTACVYRPWRRRPRWRRPPAIPSLQGTPRAPRPFTAAWACGTAASAGGWPS